MSYDYEIPEYALQPAKGPSSIAAKEIYDVETIFCLQDERDAVYEFEEDILVPDVKPDMRDILMIEADCSVIPRRKELEPATDDPLSLMGNLTLQLIYISDDEEDSLLSIKTKVPYKFQLTQGITAKCMCSIGCDIVTLEHLIINERKFRIKGKLNFHVRYYGESKIRLFKGVEDEQLEMCEEPLCLTNLAEICEEQQEIEERFSIKDKDIRPEQILSQDYKIIENYRQIAREKIIINGFIYCRLFCRGSMDMGEESKEVFYQHEQRVEFSQFLSIKKENRGKKWCNSLVEFVAEGLETTISVTEEKEYNFLLKGLITTRVELFESVERSMVNDAYHREKEFRCKKEISQLYTLDVAPEGEISTREILSLGKDIRMEEIVYVCGRLQSGRVSCERGRALAEGSIDMSILYRDKEGQFCVHREKLGYRGAIENNMITSKQVAGSRILLKNLWCEIINESQVEVNGQILLRCECRTPQNIVNISDSEFVSTGTEVACAPIVIALVKHGESLWDLAKKYKTTTKTIKDLNGLEDEPVEGKKLLITR